MCRGDGVQSHGAASVDVTQGGGSGGWGCGVSSPRGQAVSCPGRGSPSRGSSVLRCESFLETL